MSDSLAGRIREAAALLKKARKVAVFTGAGISTESGISDFRSPGGVWDRHRIVTYQEFTGSAEARREYWGMKRELHRELLQARPNRAHTALADLERVGRLDCLITQNIDGLHQKGGVSPGRVIEIHGTNLEAECLDCGTRTPIEKIQSRLDEGETEVRCYFCDGLVKPATIMFGQSMPEEEMRRAWDCAAGCDLLFMIGSSLQVEPAASIPRVARERGASLIFINRTETPWDHIADLRFTEAAGEVMEMVASSLDP
jgi:NAD-dependent deacetylase